jgi:hypothetical protein
MRALSVKRNGRPTASGTRLDRSGSPAEVWLPVFALHAQSVHRRVHMRGCCRQKGEHTHTVRPTCSKKSSHSRNACGMHVLSMNIAPSSWPGAYDVHSGAAAPLLGSSVAPRVDHQRAMSSLSASSPLRQRARRIMSVQCHHNTGDVDAMRATASGAVRFWKTCASGGLAPSVWLVL